MTASRDGSILQGIGADKYTQVRVQLCGTTACHLLCWDHDSQCGGWNILVVHNC